MSIFLTVFSISKGHYVQPLMEEAAEKLQDWRGKDAKYSTIFIEMNNETTTIDVTYDAHGLYYLSNLEKHGSAVNIAKQLQNCKAVLKESICEYP